MTQDAYIEILFAECGFDAQQRRDWLRAEYGRASADGLPWDEKSKLIDRLKALKAAKREGARPARDEASGLLDFGEVAAPCPHLNQYVDDRTTWKEVRCRDCGAFVRDFDSV